MTVVSVENDWKFVREFLKQQQGVRPRPDVLAALFLALGRLARHYEDDEFQGLDHSSVETSYLANQRRKDKC